MSRWRRALARLTRRPDPGPPSSAGLGFVRPGELDRVVVLAPHPDDAVLSVGDLVAVAGSATVVTVFAGSPTVYPVPLGAWDRECGFGPGDDVAALRRAEDERAVARLGGVVVHLPFPQQVHRPRSTADPAPPDDLEAVLADRIRSVVPTAVVVPLGVGHPEHRTVADAALRIRRVVPEPVWLAYADVPYAAEPGRLVARLGELAASGLVLEPVVPPVDPMARARKVAAFEAYVSQADALDRRWGMRRRLRETPESLWRITN